MSGQIQLDSSTNPPPNPTLPPNQEVNWKGYFVAGLRILLPLVSLAAPIALLVESVNPLNCVQRGIRIALIVVSYVSIFFACIISGHGICCDGYSCCKRNSSSPSWCSIGISIGSIVITCAAFVLTSGLTGSTRDCP